MSICLICSLPICNQDFEILFLLIFPRYWVFRAWGRTSTEIGDTTTNSFDTLDEARNFFDYYYEQKTGNVFGTEFVKQPGLYYEIDIHYHRDELEAEKCEQSKVKSKLPVKVQNLIRLLFDEKLMNQMMIDFDLDVEKMPLGKISEKQIQEAVEVLNTISNLIETESSPGCFNGLSNKFYSLIPHNFGLKHPPVIDTINIVDAKMEMLESLLEMGITHDFIQEQIDLDENPFDAHYVQLKAHIRPVDRGTEEFAILEKYVKNTHGATHKFQVHIEDIFQVDRIGEKHRFERFKSLHNRQLLWHGSRLTNIVGILSHGLMIPKSITFGDMFGKGIYFADMVTKSAQYSHYNNRQNKTGLILLCEVALGDSLELVKGKKFRKTPKGKDSVKGIGKIFPNPDEHHFLENGVKIPCGKPIADTSIISALDYNEYIVYDEAQIKIKYLFKVNFEFKYKD